MATTFACYVSLQEDEQITENLSSYSIDEDESEDVGYKEEAPPVCVTEPTEYEFDDLYVHPPSPRFAKTNVTSALHILKFIISLLFMIFQYHVFISL